MGISLPAYGLPIWGSVPAPSIKLNRTNLHAYSSMYTSNYLFRENQENSKGPLLPFIDGDCSHTGRQLPTVGGESHRSVHFLSGLRPFHLLEWYWNFWSGDFSWLGTCSNFTVYGNPTLPGVSGLLDAYEASHLFIQKKVRALRSKVFRRMLTKDVPVPETESSDAEGCNKLFMNRIQKCRNNID